MENQNESQVIAIQMPKNATPKCKLEICKMYEKALNSMSSNKISEIAMSLPLGKFKVTPYTQHVSLDRLKVVIQRVGDFNDVPLPVYKTKGSSGLDLHACIEEDFIFLKPGCRQVISAGFCISIPEGYEAQIRPRSGLALNHGISVLNSPGTLDSDYRGIVGVILINHGNKEFKIERGMRIAQIVIQPVIQVYLDEGIVDETERGAGGFGHTGH